MRGRAKAMSSFRVSKREKSSGASTVSCAGEQCCSLPSVFSTKDWGLCRIFSYAANIAHNRHRCSMRLTYLRCVNWCSISVSDVLASDVAQVDITTNKQNFFCKPSICTIYGCRSMPNSWSLLFICVCVFLFLGCSLGTPLESCIVNRRLPAFVSRVLTWHTNRIMYRQS
jgi:hypothetical protein